MSAVEAAACSFLSVKALSSPDRGGPHSIVPSELADLHRLFARVQRKSAQHGATVNPVLRLIFFITNAGLRVALFRTQREEAVNAIRPTLRAISAQPGAILDPVPRLILYENGLAGGIVFVKDQT